MADPSRAWAKESRLDYSAQTQDDRYSLPENFLEIEVCNPITLGEGSSRYVSYEIHVSVRTVFHLHFLSKMWLTLTFAIDQHPQL